MEGTKKTCQGHFSSNCWTMRLLTQPHVVFGVNWLCKYCDLIFQLKNGLKSPQVKLHSLLFNFLWDYLLTQLLVHVSCSLMTVSSLSLTSNFLQDGYQGATVDVSKAQQCVNAKMYIKLGDVIFLIRCLHVRYLMRLLREHKLWSVYCIHFVLWCKY